MYLLPSIFALSGELYTTGHFSCLEPEEYEQSVKTLLRYRISVAHPFITARLASQSFQALFGDDRNHNKRGNRVCPPPACSCVKKQPVQQNGYYSATL
jgi:hypothetical protein